MANMGELMLALLAAAEVRSVAEVGAYAGDLTEVLIDWAGDRDATVAAVDPLPQPALVELAARCPELDLIEKTSADAFREIELPDAIIIDGDHNYHTVSEELRAIGDRADGAELPLLLFHDVCWPHGRRDSYYAPERIPDEYHDSIAEGVGVFPGEPGVTDGGLPYQWAAVREGGERNGVMTAVEDWVGGRDRVRLVVVPMFFGFAVCWHEEASWASEVESLVSQWNENPIIARLEANRVFHLASHHRSQVQVHRLNQELARIGALEARNRAYEEVLRDLLGSRSLSAIDRLARWRHPGRDGAWNERIRAVLGEPG